MKTNQVMLRPMGCFSVEQRTKDGMFNATALLKQWNESAGEKKEIKKFFENQNTKEFISALIEEENLNGEKSAYLTSRGKYSGGTWMPIKGFNNEYWVSSEGVVVSFKGGTPSILKGNITKKGYVRISFHHSPTLVQKFLHRIVAETFIPNPNNLKEINHKNGDKTDNRVENLEWCDSKYNSWHKFHILGYTHSQETRAKISTAKSGKRLSEAHRLRISEGHKGLKRSNESIVKSAKSHELQIGQYSKEGILISTFKSLSDAAVQTSVCLSSISAVCNGKRKTAGGFVWKCIAG